MCEVLEKCLQKPQALWTQTDKNRAARCLRGLGWNATESDKARGCNGDIDGSQAPFHHDLFQACSQPCSRSVPGSNHEKPLLFPVFRTSESPLYEWRSHLLLLPNGNNRNSRNSISSQQFFRRKVAGTNQEQLWSARRPSAAPGASCNVSQRATLRVHGRRFSRFIAALRHCLVTALIVILDLSRLSLRRSVSPRSASRKPLPPQATRAVSGTHVQTTKGGDATRWIVQL